MKSDKIEEFLQKRLITSPSTCKNYRMNIQSYFKIIDKDMNGYFNNGYTLEDYDNDLRKVYKVQYEKGRPDLSTRTFFNSVKQFMIANKKELKDLEFWDILKARTRGAEPESDEAILNASDIKTILSHGDAKARALFLMLASSGRRIGEILSITPDDVNLSVTPTTINIRKSLDSKTTKTKMKTICYISDEATESYKTWMKERDSYHELSIKRATIYKKDPDDKRVFPMSYSNALIIWKTLLMRAKLVETESFKNKWSGKMQKKIKLKNKGDRILQHPHCLRKFFRSYLGDSDFAEYLMGHSTMLTRAYRKKKPEDLAKQYLEVMPNVTIFSTQSKDVKEINKALAEKDKEMTTMKETIEEMKIEILNLKVQKLESFNDVKRKK